MKATRSKPEDPKKDSFFASERWKRFQFIVKDSARETVRDAGLVVVLIAVAAGAWYFFFRGGQHKLPVKSFLPVESKAAPLVDALEKYRAEKGVYPKAMRDAFPGKPLNGLIYRGRERELVLSDACAEAPFSDPCWKGYRRYLLLAEDTGKEYAYSSDTKIWKEV